MDESFGENVDSGRKKKLEDVLPVPPEGLPLTLSDNYKRFQLGLNFAGEVIKDLELKPGDPGYKHVLKRALDEAAKE